MTDFLATIGRASGGPVVPGQTYTVGENGPETLMMGQSGGYVMPSVMPPVGGGGKSGTTVTVDARGSTFLGTPEENAGAIQSLIDSAIDRQLGFGAIEAGVTS
jgi:hypothetical protein